VVWKGRSVEKEGGGGQTGVIETVNKGTGRKGNACQKGEGERNKLLPPFPAGKRVLQNTSRIQNVPWRKKTGNKVLRGEG